MIDNLIKSIIIKFLEYKDIGKFSIHDKIFFYTQLAYLLEGGINILEAILLVKNNSDNFAIKQICDQIYDGLKRGENLYRSMMRLPRYFNDGDVNIVKSGELSGELQKVLKYLSTEYEFIYETRNKYIGAMIYPALVFLVAIVALYIIFRYVLPGIISVLDQFQGAEMPLSTKILIIITNAVGSYSYHFFIVLFFMLFAVSIILSTNDGRKAFERYLFTMPIFGKITKYYNVVRFLRYMKLLLSSGMNYVDVFRSLKDIMGGSLYKEMIENILVMIRKGESITTVFENYTIIIPKDIVSLIKVGENTASTLNSIENGMNFYSNEFNKILNNLSKIIEPLLIIFVGGVVAFIAISVFSIIGSVLDSLKY